MEKVATRTVLKADSRDLAYGLSRSVEERIAAVELLRQQGLQSTRMLNKDFKEFAGLLNSTGVEYSVVL